MVYTAVIGSVGALVGLVALWGWYRHRLELEAERIAAAVRFAQRSLAQERGREDQNRQS
jgi:hypothetical protein